MADRGIGPKADQFSRISISRRTERLGCDRASVNRGQVIDFDGDSGAAVKPGGIQTFLIADIRGYTRFTQAEGDEAAGRLAERFASLDPGERRSSWRAAARAQGGRGARHLRFPQACSKGGGRSPGPLPGSDRGRARASSGRRHRHRRGRGGGGRRGLSRRRAQSRGPTVQPRRARGDPHQRRGHPSGAAHTGDLLSVQGQTAAQGPGSGDRGGQGLLPGGGPGLEVRGAESRAWCSPATRPPRRLVGSVAGAAVVVVALGLFFMSMRAPVQGRGLAADSVGLIDLDTGEVIARVKVGDRPGGVAVGAGSVWVTNSGSGTVTRIDPATSAVIDDCSGRDRALWHRLRLRAAVGRQRPRRDRVAHRSRDQHRGPEDRGRQRPHRSGGRARVGVGHQQARRHDHEIDPATGNISKTIDVGDGPTDIALGYGAVWVTNQHASTVSKIDPDANTATNSVNVGNGPLGITTGGGALWVANSLDDTVSRDRSRGQIRGRQMPVGSGPGDVTWSDGALWVTNETDGTLSKIDASSSEVVDTVDIGASPAVTAVTAEGLWVAVRDDGTSHRGGTITIVSSEPMDSIDPGVAYVRTRCRSSASPTTAWSGSSGPEAIEGATLVPNLATELPTPTDGGRTYTFQLRPDIRYSTGKHVTASDVRSSLERTLATPGPRRLLLREDPRSLGVHSEVIVTCPRESSRTTARGRSPSISRSPTQTFSTSWRCPSHRFSPPTPPKRSTGGAFRQPAPMSSPTTSPDDNSSSCAISISESGPVQPNPRVTRMRSSTDSMSNLVKEVPNSFQAAPMWWGGTTLATGWRR